MTKKFLLHFNVLYLGVFLSLIILPSLAWSQVFEEEIEDTPSEEVVLAQESVEDEVQPEAFVNPLEPVVEESLTEEILVENSEPEEEPLAEGEGDENQIAPVLEEPAPNDLEENQETLINEEPEVLVDEEPLAEEIVQELLPEEPVIEEPILEEIPREDTIPTLSVRRFEKPIFLDKEALHSCEADNFRLDVSDKQRISGKILLNKNSDIAYEVEVGSLPDGIDIRFSDNREYLYQPGSSENVLEFDIVRQDGAQKGDFTIPFIYTQKGLGDSSVICQFNIVNL